MDKGDAWMYFISAIAFIIVYVLPIILFIAVLEWLIS